MKPPVAEMQQGQHHSIVEVDQLSVALMVQLLSGEPGQLLDTRAEYPLSTETEDQPPMLSNVPMLGQIDLPPRTGRTHESQPQGRNQFRDTEDRKQFRDTEGRNQSRGINQSQDGDGTIQS